MKERAWPPQKKETIVVHNDCHNAPLSNDNLLQEVSKVMAETEE